MKRAVAIQHVAFEDLGTWHQPISDLYSLEYVHAADRQLAQLANQKIDLLIVLGGPIGVYQEQDYPLSIRKWIFCKNGWPKNCPLWEFV